MMGRLRRRFCSSVVALVVVVVVVVRGSSKNRYRTPPPAAGVSSEGITKKNAIEQTSERIHALERCAQLDPTRQNRTMNAVMISSEDAHDEIDEKNANTIMHSHPKEGR